MRIGQRELTEREARTVRFAGIALGAYLVVYVIVFGGRGLDRSVERYEEVRGELASLETEVLRRRKDAKDYAELRRHWRLEFESLTSDKLVSEVRESIEKYASSSGVRLAGSREAGSGGADRARLQLELTGSAEKVFGFVENLDTLGLPLYVRSFHLNRDGHGPGKVGVSLAIGVLDYRKFRTGGPGA